MDIKKPQLGKVEAFAFVFQREFCNTIRFFVFHRRPRRRSHAYGFFYL